MVTRVFGIGAQNKATTGCANQGLQTSSQVVALFRRDFLRHANVVVLRQKHQVPTRNRNLRGQTRTLGANGILDHLHHQRLALKNLSLNWHQGLVAAGRLGGLAFGLSLPNVGYMQKSCAFQTDVDEG